MDQRNLAGIGNLYKAETLFLRGINPWRRSGDVPELPELVETGPPHAGGQQGTDRPGHDRSPGARRADLGLRAGRPALPPLRRARSRKANLGPVLEERVTVLVPALPAAAETAT